MWMCTYVGGWCVCVCKCVSVDVYVHVWVCGMSLWGGCVI